MARLPKISLRVLFFLPVILAFTTAVYLLLIMSSTSELYISPSRNPVLGNSVVERSVISTPPHLHSRGKVYDKTYENKTSRSAPAQVRVPSLSRSFHRAPAAAEPYSAVKKNKDVFHDGSFFRQEYLEMNRSLKIYAYPHKKNDPFANVLLPVDSQPDGNYASESFFKKSLFSSHFLTDDPSEADLFYMPFSIVALRKDKRVGIGGIKNFVRDYVSGISRKFPYWNRTGGADHFYVACHSIGRSAMEKAVKVKINAIQVVCSSSYFLTGYVAHKDASIPQIWPRKGKQPSRHPSKRKMLAFYAGAMNSVVREFLVETWKNDAEISVHRWRLKTSYSEALLGSKFCIHAKGYEVNTARVGDALYYGCVPVVLADHYDLPFADILNWDSFSVVVPTLDIPNLKRILKKIRPDEYVRMQGNVVRVQKHFRWHNVPADYDAFHMVMYELWRRRSHARISFDLSAH